MFSGGEAGEAARPPWQMRGRLREEPRLDSEGEPYMGGRAGWGFGKGLRGSISSRLAVR